MVEKSENTSSTSSRASMARQKIMTIATGLFSERGYGSVGINEVGQRAGFGKGALYYHIRSKEDLLVSIIDEQMTGLIAETEAALSGAGDLEMRIAALTDTFVTLLFANPAAMTLCYRDIHALVEAENIEAVGTLHDVYRRLWAEALNNGSDHKIPPQDIEVLVGMLFASVFWVTPDTSAKALTQTFARTVRCALTR